MSIICFLTGHDYRADGGSPEGSRPVGFSIYFRPHNGWIYDSSGHRRSRECKRKRCNRAETEEAIGECLRCQGTGELKGENTGWFPPNSPPPEEFDRECDVCGGTGKRWQKK
jgi:hypothetical protein